MPLNKTQNQKQNQNPLDNSNKKENTNTWCFIACPKVLIAKRTESYALIKLPYGWSVIVNARFIRSKESEENIYMSIPNDYKINARRTHYNENSKKFEVVETNEINAKELLHEIITFRNFFVEKGLAVEDILDFTFEELPF